MPISCSPGKTGKPNIFDPNQWWIVGPEWDPSAGNRPLSANPDAYPRKDTNSGKAWGSPNPRGHGASPFNCHPNAPARCRDKIIVDDGSGTGTSSIDSNTGGDLNSVKWWDSDYVHGRPGGSFNTVGSDWAGGWRDTLTGDGVLTVRGSGSEDYIYLGISTSSSALAADEITSVSAMNSATRPDCTMSFNSNMLSLSPDGGALWANAIVKHDRGAIRERGGTKKYGLERDGNDVYLIEKVAGQSPRRLSGCGPHTSHVHTNCQTRTKCTLPGAPDAPAKISFYGQNITDTTGATWPTRKVKGTGLYDIEWESGPAGEVCRDWAGTCENGVLPYSAPPLFSPKIQDVIF